MRESLQQQIWSGLYSCFIFILILLLTIIPQHTHLRPPQVIQGMEANGSWLQLQWSCTQLGQLEELNFKLMELQLTPSVLLPYTDKAHNTGLINYFTF